MPCPRAQMLDCMRQSKWTWEGPVKNKWRPTVHKVENQQNGMCPTLFQTVHTPHGSPGVKILQIKNKGQAVSDDAREQKGMRHAAHAMRTRSKLILIMYPNAIHVTLACTIASARADNLANTW